MPPFTPLTVRARRALVRPGVRRLAVAALAVATGLTVTSLVGAAQAARRSWGATRPVAVATRDLAVGETLGASAVDRRDLPVTAVPERALADAPVGAVVRHPIAAGEALVDDRLAPQGLTGAAALVPAGSRALAVPLAPVGAPPLAVGDLVDVLAVVPPGSGVGPADPAGGDGYGAGDGDGRRGGEAGTDGHAGASDAGAAGDDPAFPLVEQVPVVAVGEESASVAVPRDAAPAVAYALAQGAVVLALAGP